MSSRDILRKKPPEARYKILMTHWIGMKFAHTKIEAMKEIKKQLKKHPLSIGYLHKKIGVKKTGGIVWKRIGTYEMKKDPKTKRWRFVRVHYRDGGNNNE